MQNKPNFEPSVGQKIIRGTRKKRRKEGKFKRNSLN